MVIYIFGVIGLMITHDLTLDAAIVVGVVPFLVGDLIKARGGRSPASRRLALGGRC